MNNRTQASSFDAQTFDEVMEFIDGMGGKTRDAGIPEDFDDELLGQNAKDEAEVNYQRGQEIATMMSCLGWSYVVELMDKLVENAKKEKDAAEKDDDILLTHRDWKAMQKAVHIIKSRVESAAAVPHPSELPS